MKIPTLHRRYDAFTPEERFRLILAASARRDEVESDRLQRSAMRLTLVTGEHVPWSNAFQELAWLVYVELLADAAEYQDMLHHYAHADRDEDGDSPSPSLADRHRDVAFARGYFLRTKLDGWVQFCEARTLPPYLLWESLPGYVRFREIADLTQANDTRPPLAFIAEEMTAYLTRLRPRDTPPTLLSHATSALELEETFLTRVALWSGR